MKKYVLLIIVLAILVYSYVFAALIDVNKITFKDNSLVFPDLQTIALDKYGKPVKDYNTGEYYYKYHRATNEIIKTSAIGLTQGYEDGNFKPDEVITKGEFIKLAMMLATNRNFDFSAMPKKINHWCNPYVVMGEMQNVLEVGEYNEKNLNEPITRIEMICILSRIQINMKGVSQYTDATLPAYTDVDTLTEEEKGLLLHAARYELIAGMFDKDSKGEYTIRPYEYLTRADAAVAIMRIY